MTTISSTSVWSKISVQEKKKTATSPLKYSTRSRDRIISAKSLSDQFVGFRIWKNEPCWKVDWHAFRSLRGGQRVNSFIDLYITSRSIQRPHPWQSILPRYNRLSEKMMARLKGTDVIRGLAHTSTLSISLSRMLLLIHWLVHFT